MRRPLPALAKLRSDVSGIGWPPISLGEPAMLAALLRQIDDTQWLARAEIVAQQFRQLALLAAHCEKYSPQFRRRLARAGMGAADLSSPEMLRRLPVLTRREVQDAGDLFCSEVPEGHAPVHETRTSGSTGAPLMLKRSAIGNVDWFAYTLREHLWQDRDFTKPLCVLRAQIDIAERRDDWGPPVNLLFDTGPLLAIPLGTDIRRQAEMIADFAPEGLLIYPNNLAALVEAVAAGRASLPSLRHIRTLGETLTPQVRADAERVLSAKLADNYSSQEIGLIASECPDAPLYHVMETVIVEILDTDGNPCAAGESGRVVVTDLRNFATPMIRYDIGDYAQAGPPCPCRRGLPTITRILGRERNLALLPDGRRFWPLVGALKFRDIAPVRQYQIIQDEPDRLEFRLVSDTPVTQAQEDALRALVRAAMDYPFRVEFTYLTDAIPRGANGKFEEFICRVTR